jgi:hypothetical protein
MDSGQVPNPSLPRRGSQLQDQRGQVYDQVPAEEGAVHGCCRRQRRYDGGRAHRKHHAVHQLPRLAPEEGMAERGQLDHQGHHVAAKASLLDALRSTKATTMSVCGWAATSVWLSE